MGDGSRTMDGDRGPAGQSGPAPRQPPLVDTHCHLDGHAFDPDRDEVIRRALDAGVTRMLTIGIDARTSRAAVDLADRYAAVYAAVGVHPNSAAGFNRDALNDLRALARHPKTVAIGEIGLDHYWNKVDPAAQERAFREQLDMAAELGKPVIIHSRQASDAALAVLENHAVGHRRPAGVLHSFSGSLEVAQRALALGFLIGISGPVTFKKSDALRAVARSMPADRLLVETDAPFLAPEPMRGRRNEPAYVRWIAEQVARVRDMSLDALARQLADNAAGLFGWTMDHATAST